MARTLAQLRSDVRSRLEEATATFWSDAEIARWINEGQNDIARRTECLRATDDIAVTAGTQTYDGPTDLVRATAMEWRPSSSSAIHPLTYRDKHSADSLWGTTQGTTDGTPLIWTSWGSPPTLTIQVYPTPIEDGTLRLFYYKFPTELSTDTDSVGVPTGWEDLVAEYATMHALRKDGDPRWQEAFQLYTDHLNHLLETAVRFNDQAGQIDDAMGGVMTPTWLYMGEGDW